MHNNMVKQEAQNQQIQSNCDELPFDFYAVTSFHFPHAWTSVP